MKIKLLMAGCFLMFLALEVTAQETEKRFGLEFNGGISMATRKLNDADLKTGLGFEGIVHYRFMPHTGFYAGWGWNKFSADKSFAGNKMDFEETGYVLGLQFQHPLGTTPVFYYLRAGGLYNHIEIENRDGDIINDSGHGFGWQVAGGVNIPLGSKWRLTPGVKFNALSRKTDFEGVATQMDLNYLSLRIGLVRKL